VDQIIESIVDQIGDHPVKVSTVLPFTPQSLDMSMMQYVLVVGGFGESPYLRKRLRNAPGLRHVKFTVPDQSGYARYLFLLE
jgi:hypothetical protein